MLCLEEFVMITRRENETKRNATRRNTKKKNKKLDEERNCLLAPMCKFILKLIFLIVNTRTSGWWSNLRNGRLEVEPQEWAKFSCWSFLSRSCARRRERVEVHECSPLILSSKSRGIEWRIANNASSLVLIPCNSTKCRRDAHSADAFDQFSKFSHRLLRIFAAI